MIQFYLKGSGDKPHPFHHSINPYLAQHHTRLNKFMPLIIKFNDMYAYNQQGIDRIDYSEEFIDQLHEDFFLMDMISYLSSHEHEFAGINLQSGQSSQFIDDVNDPTGQTLAFCKPLIKYGAVSILRSLITFFKNHHEAFTQDQHRLLGAVFCYVCNEGKVNNLHTVIDSSCLQDVLILFQISNIASFDFNDDANRVYLFILFARLHDPASPLYLDPIEKNNLFTLVGLSRSIRDRFDADLSRMWYEYAQPCYDTVQSIDKDFHLKGLFWFAITYRNELTEETFRLYLRMILATIEKLFDSDQWQSKAIEFFVDSSQFSSPVDVFSALFLTITKYFQAESICLDYIVQHYNSLPPKEKMTCLDALLACLETLPESRTSTNCCLVGFVTWIHSLTESIFIQEQALNRTNFKTL